MEQKTVRPTYFQGFYQQDLHCLDSLELYKHRCTMQLRFCHCLVIVWSLGKEVLWDMLVEDTSSLAVQKRKRLLACFASTLGLCTIPTMLKVDVIDIWYMYCKCRVMSSPLRMFEKFWYPVSSSHIIDGFYLLNFAWLSICSLWMLEFGSCNPPFTSESLHLCSLAVRHQDWTLWTLWSLASKNHSKDTIHQ